MSPDVGVRKVSNSKSDLQGHSTSPVMKPFDRPHNDFLLVFHRNYDYLARSYKLIFAEYWKDFKAHLTAFTRPAVTPPKVNRFG